MLNRGHKHWILVVMNNKKREFQVLDSLWTLYMSTLWKLRSWYVIILVLVKLKSIVVLTCRPHLFLYWELELNVYDLFCEAEILHLPTNMGTWNVRSINNLLQQTDGWVNFQHWSSSRCIVVSSVILFFFPFADTPMDYCAQVYGTLEWKKASPRFHTGQ